MKIFAANLAQDIFQASQHSKVAGIIFGSQVETKIAWDFSANSDTVVEEINKLVYVENQPTEIHLAFDMAVDDLFHKERGDRSDIPDVAVIITDGVPSYTRLAMIASRRVQDAGIFVFSVGIIIGYERYQMEPYMKAFASKPKVSADNKLKKNKNKTKQRQYTL